MMDSCYEDKWFCHFSCRKIWWFGNNIAIDEAVMEEVRPSITEGMEENAWVQLQVEMLFSRMAAKAKMVKPHQQMLSKRLRGIAHAPKDFDYKKELEERF